ncbi:MAG: SNF2-related protein, partial [Pseudomonadales bacterium]
RLIHLDLKQEGPWIDALTRNRTVDVPYADRNAFLDWLWRSPSVPHIEWPQDLAPDEVHEPPRGHLAIITEGSQGNARFFAGHVFFLYGELRAALHEARRGWFDAKDNRVVARETEAEHALLAELADAGIMRTPAHSRVMGDVRVSRTHFEEIVGTLTARGWTVEADGKRFRPAGEFKMQVSSGIDWFDLHGALHFGELSISLPSVLKALRQGETFVALDDGSQGLLPEDWLERYGKIARLGRVEGDALRFGAAQALLIDALLGEQKSVDMDASFRRLRKRLRGSEDIMPAFEPQGFHGVLRDYQREGLGWLNFLRELETGGCLADDMGLGKTVQVLALMQLRRLTKRERTTSIVVVPKSLIFNWLEEAARFTPELDVLDYTGAGRKVLLSDAHYDLVLTTYGTLRRDIVTLKDMHFDYAILDESQAIKNHNSQIAKASRLICADHRLALTGTPVENHIGELWSLFEFLNPGMLGGSTAFKDLAKGETDDATVELLGRALRPFILRRTKAQVLPELPEKTEQTLHCELSAKERRQYDELRDHYRNQLLGSVHELGFNKTRMHVLEALLRLRQAACHPGLLDSTQIGEASAKLDTLEKQLEEIVAEGHKVLVFSQFTSLLAIVRKRLEQQGIVYEYLDGRTRKRGERVKRFQDDADCPVFLISLKAGGHGLNLTAADYVIILDPWWNPAVEAQAVDRAHRIGQTRPVFAYRLIANDTIEEKILELQRSKQALADAIVSADNSLLRTLTEEDLELLLS